MSDHLYEKCRDCHLFVEPNSSFADSTPQYPIAEYVHLHRGDEVDEALDSTHEARPSGMKANLATWKAYGPLVMRQRFDDYDSTQSPQQQEAVAFLADPEWWAAARTWTPAECAASPVGASGVIQRLATALTETI